MTTTHRAASAVHPLREADRLTALRAVGPISERRHDELATLARLAAYVCGVTAARVNLVGADTQETVVAFGADVGSCERSDSMCHVSIQNEDITYTPDASRDDRWRANPHVTGLLDAIRTYAAAPLTTPGGAIVGTLCVSDSAVRPLTTDQLDRLRDIAAQASLMLQLRERIDVLDHVATRDRLTGLPNMATFDEALERALASAERTGAPVSVLFLDLDGFKAVNDTHGHAVGDDLLCEVTERLHAVMRSGELLARRSGDEFLVLAEDCTAKGARALGARLTDAVSGSIELPSATVEVGVSIGTATAGLQDTATDLLHRADIAMYRDKRRRVTRVNGREALAS